MKHLLLITINYYDPTLISIIVFTITKYEAQCVVANKKEGAKFIFILHKLICNKSYTRREYCIGLLNNIKLAVTC